ncbi:MAG: HAMP domain-containing sensor histidine kinase, partial [Oscillospiraceae bacterium]
YVDSQVITTSFAILSQAAESDVFLVNTEGKTILCSDTGGCRHTNYVLSKAVMDAALGSGFSDVTKLGPIYDQPYYTVGVPVTAGGAVVGAVFAASTASSMSRFLQEVLKMFLLGAAVFLVIAFLIIYFSTEALVRPLRAMLRATDSFAKGDFSVRVTVEGDEEVEQLARAFNNMADSLAVQESTGRSFIANVSHELRTPMTTIGGFIDGMLDGTIPDEKYHYYLGIVSNEVKRLSRMVVSMLNISRIEAGEMPLHLQTVDIHEIVCRTVLGFEQQIEEKKVEVRGLDAEKTFVEADPDLTHQVVYNLIENAVKFTPNGGYLEVSYESDGKMVSIGIKNSGDGIPKEEIPRLFDRFYKSDRSRSMNVRGVGLGLHIVKSLVHLQGGNITVRSAEGEYAQFVFTLPVDQPKKRTSEPPKRR